MQLVSQLIQFTHYKNYLLSTIYKVPGNITIVGTGDAIQNETEEGPAHVSQ